MLAEGVVVGKEDSSGEDVFVLKWNGMLLEIALNGDAIFT